jgi:hypothetical protein
MEKAANSERKSSDSLLPIRHSLSQCAGAADGLAGLLRNITIVANPT